MHELFAGGGQEGQRFIPLNLYSVVISYFPLYVAEEASKAQHAA